MAVPIEMIVNGKSVAAEIDADTLLSTFLREHLRLTGTHIGCDTASCGACTVHVGGRAVKSCNVLAAQVQGQDITTIEGITPVRVFIPCRPPSRPVTGCSADFAPRAW